MKYSLTYSIVETCSFQRKGRYQYYLVCNKTGNIERIPRDWLLKTPKRFSELKKLLSASNISHFPGAKV